MCRSVRWTVLVAVAVFAAGCSASPLTDPSFDPRDEVTIVTVCDPLMVTDDCVLLNGHR